MNKKVIERVKKSFLKWEWIVIKWGWKFDVNYCDGYEEMPDTASFNAAAIAFSEWQYLSAQIYINVKKVSGMSNSDIDLMVIHELTHLLLAPMRDGEENEEMSATTISRIIKMAGEEYDSNKAK